MSFPFPPVTFALTVPLDEFEGAGFSRSDVDRLIQWKAGTLKNVTDEDVRRFGQLELMVILTDPT